MDDRGDVGLPRPEERVLDPSNLGAERHRYYKLFCEYLEREDDEAVRRLALELSPGDLSEIIRPLGVTETARILRLLPPDPLAEVLSEIDNRSLSALFALLDVDEIADVIEEMPSDEATDLLGELDEREAQRILAAMEEEERDDVAELLQYEPETAGGLMGKEFGTVNEMATVGEAVDALRRFEEDDLDDMHFVWVVDDRDHLVGRVPFTRLLLSDRSEQVRHVMERDPLYVDVDLDQEDVAQFFMTHDLISLPVVDRRGRMVGRITVDDVLDVLEEEATEDISHLAGVSVQEFGEDSSYRVARSRLPWLVGGLLGQMGAVLVLQHFEESIARLVALSFFFPVIMATAGNVGIQSSSVVVRGLATGEVGGHHFGRHILRELGTAVLMGLVVAGLLVLGAWFITDSWGLALVLGLTVLLVILFAATVGTGIPMILHRLRQDPAAATGPFITTANDIVALLIYLGLATALLGLGSLQP
ncbi:MAG: magnesium transporter [Candidatus Krumholzibacteriia bacterium]